MPKFQKSKTERRSKSHKRESFSKIKISENYDALMYARKLAHSKDQEIRRSRSMDESNGIYEESKGLQDTPTFGDKPKER